MDGDSFVMWSMRIVYIALLVVVLLVTVSRLRFPIIINRVRRALGSKHRRFILNSCMLAAIVMMLFMVDPVLQHVMILLDLCGFAILSFGNLQIPAAIVREELARMRLTQHDSFGVGSTLHRCQHAGGLLVHPSEIPRSPWWIHRGVESVNLYYAYAFDKYMEGDVFAPKRINLSNFAIDSINSDLSKNQLYGIRMMHTFLQRDLTRAQLLEKLTTSTQTKARLINMLDWTDGNHHTTVGKKTKRKEKP
uniref:Uncharacterized protein n=1 Tax=Oryza barthii TaxID=65489 RepID=A0A0D3HNW6_9ORYZ